MSIAKIKQEKENKIFKRWDILVYAIILVVIAVLFLTVFLTKDKSEIEGFKVSIDGSIVYTYNFDTKEEFIVDKNIQILERTDSNIKIRVHLSDLQSDYNILNVNLQDREIEVLDTDCSVSKDCMSMKIKSMSDTIICVPHKLIVEPIGKGDVKDPSVG